MRMFFPTVGALVSPESRAFSVLSMQRIIPFSIANSSDQFVGISYTEKAYHTSLARLSSQEEVKATLELPAVAVSDPPAFQPEQAYSIRQSIPSFLFRRRGRNPCLITIPHYVNILIGRICPTNSQKATRI